MKYICKYCGKECKNKNSLVHHERLCKLNPNREVSNIFNYNEKLKSGELKPSNQYIKAKQLGLKKPELSVKAKEKISNIWKGKHLTVEHKKKIAIGRKKYLEEHPDQIPYKLHHSSQISYPEQYFKDIFEKENIPLKYHLQVGLYELDFYNEEYKVYIEIDGDTHKQKKVQEIDKRKDEYLQSLGWKCMRICWADYKKLLYGEKELELEKIKKFVLEHNG